MSKIEQEIMKSLLMSLAKRIEEMDKTIHRFEHALRWFDKTAKEVHDSMKYIKGIMEKEE